MQYKQLFIHMMNENCFNPYFNLTSVRVFGRGGSQFPLFSSSIKHTWTQVLGFQQLQQVCIWEMSFPFCPCTCTISVQNYPSCCITNHELPLMQLPLKPSLKKQQDNLFVTKSIIFVTELEGRVSVKSSFTRHKLRGTPICKFHRAHSKFKVPFGHFSGERI